MSISIFWRSYSRVKTKWRSEEKGSKEDSAAPIHGKDGESPDQDSPGDRIAEGNQRSIGSAMLMSSLTSSIELIKAIHLPPLDASFLMNELKVLLDKQSKNSGVIQL